MPTVTEPTNQAAKPQLESPKPVEPELFAAEIEMEKKSSNFFPLLLIAGLIFVVGGTIYYFVKGAQDVLTAPVATATISQVLNAQSAATIRFSTGTVVSSVSEKPLDPHYKLLAKAGVVVTKPKGANSLIVTMTPAGETLLDNITGVQKSRNPDGGTTYLVPLAERKLVSVDKVTMLKPHLAKVDYTWQWKANRLGQEFDASGSLVKSFSTWDRSTLIKSYGVDFYSAAPAQSSIVLMEGDNGAWKPYSE
ncbi:MAG TPA: hypothetical protein VLW48_00025 [Candidatus Bathyarchaeia archaeon]|nr:hypothetical protein [Candidatus Bathyarchaeia archaeon]